jgi:hypothetical protein
MSLEETNNVFERTEGAIQLDRTYIEQQKRLIEELHRHRQSTDIAEEVLQKLESL